MLFAVAVAAVKPSVYLLLYSVAVTLLCSSLVRRKISDRNGLAGLKTESLGELRDKQTVEPPKIRFLCKPWIDNLTFM